MWRDLRIHHLNQSDIRLVGPEPPGWGKTSILGVLGQPAVLFVMSIDDCLRKNRQRVVSRKIQRPSDLNQSDIRLVGPEPTGWEQIRILLGLERWGRRNGWRIGSGAFPGATGAGCALDSTIDRYFAWV